MTEFTRRGFVTKSATAAAGLTVIGELVSEEAEAATPDARDGTHEVMAFVSDRRKGEITVMTSDSQRSFRNRKLAADIARHAR